MDESQQNITVMCRFRPPNEAERKAQSKYCVEFPSDNSVLCQDTGDGVKHQFTFDHIFPPTTRQLQIFEKMRGQVVESIFEGFNATLFCYGQTGAGKTYTMMGPYLDSQELEDTSGLIPRIAENIFTTCVRAPDYMEFTITVSYFELYNEKIQDLLDPSRKNLACRGDGIRVPISIQNLSERSVSSRHDILSLIYQGNQNRVVSETYMNKESSRSHAVFVLNLEQKNSQSGELKKASLYLVDLAGSEKVSRSGVEGIHLKEATNINLSLTALGIVISKLAKGEAHIPYRDSVLTRVLQNSLGGNSRTTLLIGCSPADYNATETLSTLRFGARAKEVKNRVRMNKLISIAEYKVMVARLQEENAELKKKCLDLEDELNIVKHADPAAAAAAIASASASSSTSTTAATTATTSSPSSNVAPIPSNSGIPTSASISGISSDDSGVENLSDSNNSNNDIASNANPMADENSGKAGGAGGAGGLNSAFMMKQMLGLHQRKARELQEELKQLKTTFESTLEELDRANNELDELRVNYRDKEESAETLQEQLSRSCKAEERLQAELDAREKDLSDLRKIHGKLEMDSDSIRSEFAVIREHLNTKTLENKNLNLKIADLQKQIIDLEIEMTATRSKSSSIHNNNTNNNHFQQNNNSNNQQSSSTSSTAGTNQNDDNNNNNNGNVSGQVNNNSNLPSFDSSSFANQSQQQQQQQQSQSQNDSKSNSKNQVDDLARMAKDLAAENFRYRSEIEELRTNFETLTEETTKKEQARKLEMLRFYSRQKQQTSLVDGLNREIEDLKSNTKMIQLEMEELQVFKNMVTWEYMPVEYTEHLDYMKQAIKKMNKKRLASSREQLKSIQQKQQAHQAAERAAFILAGGDAEGLGDASSISGTGNNGSGGNNGGLEGHHLQQPAPEVAHVVKRIQGQGRGIGFGTNDSSNSSTSSTTTGNSANSLDSNNNNNNNNTEPAIVDWQTVYRTGYLTKEGGAHKNWKRRFFVLKGKNLAYYAKAGDREPKGVVKLEHASRVEASSAARADKPFCFVIRTAGRDYYISASSEDEVVSWVATCNAVRVMKSSSE